MAGFRRDGHILLSLLYNTMLKQLDLTQISIWGLRIM